MVQRRLPAGEETLNIVRYGGVYLTPNQITSLAQLRGGEVPTELLIERLRTRMGQGRVSTIYRLQHELSPAEQLGHMVAGDEIGLELIEAERKLVQEEIGILEERYG